VNTVVTQQVMLDDGRVVDIVQRRGHLSYCFNSCCCGRVDRGYPAVPVDAYKSEWIAADRFLDAPASLAPCTFNF
jgi:hypothetical protein